MASTLNLGTIKTPGVYIDEMSLFPPSVAQVDTAVPAFIGPTRQSRQNGQSIQGQPTRIASMAEYRSYFGGAPDRALAVTLDANNGVQRVQAGEAPYLYDSIQLYFANGGEKCYVVSTGSYEDVLKASAFENALDALKKFDEPTLLVMPDAVRLSGDPANGTPRDVHNAAVNHCHTMQDRFAILDVPMDNFYNGPSKSIGDDVKDFRDKINIKYPNYAAAYYPYLQTSLPLTVNLKKLTVAGMSLVAAVNAVGGNSVPITDSISLSEEVDKLRSLVLVLDGYAAAPNKAQFALDKLAAFGNIAITSQAGIFIVGRYKSDNSKLIADIGALTTASTATTVDPLFGQFSRDMSRLQVQTEQALAEQLVMLKATSPIYAAIVAAAEAQGAVVPPSGAIAGIYARTDADRGVWKSPANVSLAYVNGPVVAITDAEQAGMNVDPTAGKSVNAIRAFSGKGTLVWGARTLAGSDNEWRYVSVRRFFLMAEESIKKATAQFVFEANDANTWVRVRAMIENFLTLQWRAGALAGAKADNAFFVRVGLGQTMTPQDVLSGFMIIEIGMAVVRPAEFIVLRFAHKMQEA